MNNSDQTRLDKNYFLALALSMLVLVGYSFFLQHGKDRTVVGGDEARETINKTLPEDKAAETIQKNEQPSLLEKTVAPQTLYYQNDLYSVQLSNLGGTVSRIVFKGENHHSGIANTSFYEAETPGEGTFGVRFSNEETSLSRVPFQASAVPGRSGAYEFIYEKAGKYRIKKNYFFGEKEPIIALDITLENISGQEQSFPIVLQYGLNANIKDDHDKVALEAVVKAQKTSEKQMDKFTKKPFVVSDDIFWAGLIKKYFALLIKPDTKAIRNEAKVKGHHMESEMFIEPIQLASGASAKRQFFIYAGPQRYEVLGSFNAGFEDLLSRGIFGAFKILFLKSLKFFNQYCHNFGWAIILLTLVIKGLFSPLTHMSFKSMKKMQALQPKLKSLQERHKNDPAKMNQAMMELYKKNKVNPLGGCLPMVLQIPIFIAFYQMLNDAIELKGAPFIGWIKDLAAPDHLFTFPFSLPFIGEGFNVLPLLMVGSMVWQQKLTPQMGVSPEQTKMMNMMMPVMFGFMFYNMPSGLVLYWLMNNLFSIIHQGMVKGVAAIPHHDDEA